MIKKKTIIVMLCLMVASVGGGFYLYHRHQQKEELARRALCWSALQKRLAQEVSRFPGEAGIVVKDLKHGWVISFNQDVPIAAASLVKIPLMAAIFASAQDGTTSLTRNITLKESDKVGGSGILKAQPAGVVYSVEQLIAIMIAHSDNTATNLFIAMLGYDYLNAFFKRLGLQHTSIERAMLDFRFRRKGIENYTTAYDMALVLESFYRKTFLNPSVSNKCLWLLKQQKINDRIPALLPQGIE
ncbi:MAG: serine hydrolase, partial [Candidatus Omnitrophica bacterium]|nr:serine hydrolase [Candidatus Omnitrophota bacterium]